MSTGTPARRLSTGGQPPIRIFEHYVVEQVPSRDGRTPCFTAWLREELADGCRTTWDDEPIRVADTRPEFAIQVYDTTTPPSSQGHGNDTDNGVEQQLKALAQALHAETRWERDGPPGDDRDRIDVWSLPLPADLSDEERIATCKAHLLAEIAARDGGDITGFPIERCQDHGKWGRALYIIDRPPAFWNEGEGGILELLWDVNPGYRAMLVREGGEQYKTYEFEPSVARVTRAMLGDQWLKMRHGATRY
ncbi:hypothetical protein PG990_006855 [Apiospora arundinis]|uniref:Mitochondrial substrate carrier protein n=1 Tax=Apiospora arundinis TaxID=335852 RepID=A0ABR2JBT3_9PEZI